MPLTLPCLLLLLDYWPLGRLTLRAVLKQHAAARKEPEMSRAARARAVRSQPLRHRQEVIRTREWRWKAALWLVAEKLPLLALSVASSRITYLAQQKGASMAKLESLPFALRLSNVLTAYVRYIGGMIWPFDLTMFYPYETQLDPTYVTYVVMAAEVLLVITCRRGGGGLLRAALPGRGMVLVSRHLGAGHRPGAGRRPVHGRPLFLFHLHRPVHHAGLGSGGLAGAMATGAGRSDCRRRGGPGRLRRPRRRRAGLLARQRDRRLCWSCCFRGAVGRGVVDDPSDGATKSGVQHGGRQGPDRPGRRPGCRGDRRCACGGSAVAGQARLADRDSKPATGRTLRWAATGAPHWSH